MALVKKISGAIQVSPGRVVRRVGKTTSAAVNMVLPTEPNEPSDSVLDYLILIFGAKKIGKTSIGAHFPEALFIQGEPGGKALRTYQIQPKSWQEFRKIVELLESDKKFRTVVVDTVDRIWDLCFAYMCEKLVVTHPQDNDDYGKTWKMFDQEFIGWMTRLMQCGKGIVFISHETTKEIRSMSGSKHEIITTSMASQAMRFLTATVDLMGYYTYDGRNRVLRIRGDELVQCGTRLEEHFRTPDGRAVEVIPMGTSAKEAYENLMRAWNNDQSFVSPDSDEPVAETAPVKPKKKIFKRSVV